MNTVPAARPVSWQMPEFRILDLRDDYLMSRQEASRFSKAFGCPVAATTLAKLFSIGGGPEVIHFGRSPRYPVGPYKTWLRSRMTAPRRSSSEAA